MCIEITGYADGNEKRVKRLALKRARHIKQLLVKANIDHKRIITKSAGAKTPLLSSYDYLTSAEKEILFQKNRRAEIRVISWGERIDHD